MDWSLLNITHAIAHQVFPRDKVSKQAVPPKFSAQAFALSPAVTDVLRKRITTAISQNDHGFEMAIQNSGTDSFCNVGGNVATGNPINFVPWSQQLATSLNVAQSGRNLPGGALIIMRCTISAAALPCCIIIKAELQDGFTMEYANGAFTVKLLEELLLTESQRLYKIGILVQNTVLPQRPDGTNDPQAFKAFVFDYQMSSKDTREAAHYFSVNFLGLSRLPSARFATQHYFEATREFIKNSGMSDEQKFSAYDALRVQLKSNATTINPTTFANDHLPSPEVRDLYAQFLVEKGVGTATIDKDITNIASKLSRPKMKFSSGVSILAPGERISEFVTILPPEEGQDENYTHLKIRGHLDEQT